MSDRSEWPTPEKISQLREVGEASSSSVSSSCTACAAALATLALVLTREGHNFNQLSHKLFSAPLPEILPKIFSLGLRIILIPSLAALIAAVACTLLQTRFLYAPIRLAPRILRNDGYHAPLAAMSWCAFKYLATVACIGTSSVVIGWLFGFDLLNCFNQPLSEIVQRLGQIWRTILDAAILIAVVLAVLIAFLANLMFRRRHRMTRAELLSQREG